MHAIQRVSNFQRRLSRFEQRCSVLLASVLLLATPVASHADTSTSEVAETNVLAEAFAKIIENAIPREYEKRKDWGNTKQVTRGLRTDGWKIHRRKKPVKHGVWKHYRIRLVEPEHTLNVDIENAHTSENGDLGFSVVLRAKFDMWARAKVYQYGVHLIALEAVGDAEIELQIDCKLGMRLHTHDGHSGLALDPTVTDSRLDIVDFRLRRVSNAKGPIIRELGEELPGILERELHGPKLVAKLNRAINKKRDLLEVGFSELWK